MHYATFNIPFCLFVISALFASCDKEEKAIIPVITSIQLDATELTLNAGDEHQFVVTYEPFDAPAPNYKWSFSPQDSGGTISEMGLFKSLKPGNFKVEVMTTDVGDLLAAGIPITATCDVLVKPVSATQIKLSSKEIFIRLGKDTVLSYTVVPEYASVSDIKWESSDENIVKVTDGKIETVHVGDCIIKVYSEKDPTVEDRCQIVVLPPPLESISIDEKLTFEGIGVYKRLEVAYYPEEAEKPKLVWTSSDMNVAVANSDGYVTTKGIGTCRITVATEDGRLSDVCDVEVHAVKLENMYFSDDLEVSIGDARFYLDSYLHFVPSYANNHNYTLEQLSGFDVAKIVLEGKRSRIKGLKEGTATFRATAEDGGYTDVCTLRVVDKVADNVEVYIGLSSWANIAGFVTAEVRCEVFNYNEDPILVRGLDVRPSSGGSNSNSASFAYWGYVNYGRSKYWLNSFTNIYEPYYLVYFQYNNKMYTKIVDR